MSSLPSADTSAIDPDTPTPKLPAKDAPVRAIEAMIVSIIFFHIFLVYLLALIYKLTCKIFIIIKQPIKLIYATIFLKNVDLYRFYSDNYITKNYFFDILNPL